MARGWITLGSLLLLTSTLIAVAPSTSTKPDYTPESGYKKEPLRGWQLKVHKDLYDEPNVALRKQTLELLDNHLYRITRVIPENALKEIRKIPIWIELKHPKHPCMCYHPSATWLKENHMNPKKAGCVEIANVRTFLDWTHRQPWMVLHELAHAYHHQVLGFDHPGVKLCFDQAIREKIYESVLHIDGKKRRHYAATNPMEYFAEATEAYYGTNDFYPFVRAELHKHDPRIGALLPKLWNQGKKGDRSR